MERQSSVMKLRHGGAVGDRDHGESREPRLEQGGERLLRGLVHGRGGLVQEQPVGSVDEGAREADPLLFAARELE